MASLIHDVRWGISFSRKGDTRITHSGNYGVLTPQPQATIDIVTTEYITQRFYDNDIDVGRALLAFQ